MHEHHKPLISATLESFIQELEAQAALHPNAPILYLSDTDEVLVVGKVGWDAEMRAVVITPDIETIGPAN